MKHVFLLFVLLLGLIPMNAQPSIEWQRAIGGAQGDHAYSIKQAMNGSLMVAGFSLSNDGDFFGGFGATEVWLVQLDTIGNVLWKENYGGSADDRAYSIEQTADQGWVFAGFTRSNNNQVSGNHGLTDFWVVKMDSTGQIEWQKCLGGTGYDEAMDIKQTPDGGYVVVGSSDSNNGDLMENNGLEDTWIVKLDNDGSLIWQRVYGGSGTEKSHSLYCTSDGGFIVAGESFSNDGDVPDHLGGTDYWILKLNFEGKIEWSRVFGGAGHEIAYDILPCRNGGYIVVGDSRSTNGDITDNHGGSDFWVIKLEAGGNIIWERSYGGSSDDYGEAIYETSDGGFLLAGQTTSTDGDAIGNNGLADAWIIKMDSLGNIAWQKSLGGTQDELFHAVEQGADGAIYLAGHARSNNGDVSGVHGKIDYWVVKLDMTSSAAAEPLSLPLRLSPNPTGQWLSLGLPAVEQGMQIQITDATGKVQRTWITRSDTQMDVSGLVAGMYWVTAVSTSGQRYSGQLVKQ